jgi:hypothetical protein
MLTQETTQQVTRLPILARNPLSSVLFRSLAIASLDFSEVVAKL